MNVKEYQRVISVPTFDNQQMDDVDIYVHLRGLGCGVKRVDIVRYPPDELWKQTDFYKWGQRKIGN